MNASTGPICYAREIDRRNTTNIFRRRMSKEKYKYKSLSTVHSVRIDCGGSSTRTERNNFFVIFLFFFFHNTRVILCIFHLQVDVFLLFFYFLFPTRTVSDSPRYTNLSVRSRRKIPTEYFRSEQIKLFRMRFIFTECYCVYNTEIRSVIFFH